MSLRSRRIPVQDLFHAVEAFHANGSTDGLPIVPPGEDGRARCLPVGVFARRRGPCVAAALWVLLGAAGAAAAEPGPGPARGPDEAEAVLAAVRAEVPEFRPTPNQWFRVEVRRPIRLLRGARVFAVTRLSIPETRGLVALAADGRAHLLGSDWRGPCAAGGFNALVDPGQVRLEAPGGAAAFARAYLALMVLGRARLVERPTDIPDPDTDAYRDAERAVLREIAATPGVLVRPVLGEPHPDGTRVSFFVWARSELQRWELVVTRAGRVTACRIERVAGAPAGPAP